MSAVDHRHQSAPPALSKPMLVVSAGLALTVGYLVVFLILMASASAPNASERVSLTPIPTQVRLDKDQWGVYSDDPDIICSVTASDGTAVQLSKTSERTYVKPEQALYFEIPAESDYMVSCTSVLPSYLDRSAVDADYKRALRLFKILPFSMIIGLACLVAGGVWLVRVVKARRRYRHELLGMLSSPGGGHTSGWQAQQSAFAASGAGSHLAPSTPQIAYGQVASAGPAASAQTSTDLPAPGSGAPSQAASASSGPYGIAPKQVVYRAVPKQED